MRPPGVSSHHPDHGGLRATTSGFRNPAAHTTDRRRLLGKTKGGRCLTLVIEATDETTTWLVISGWESSTRERKIIEAQA
jgi:hypothetical protein